MDVSNKISLGHSGTGISRRSNKGRHEIFYNGYFYDITDFISRHPGGNIIKFYTDYGEDATQAIQQFHYRSRGMVNTIMKSLRKREAVPSDGGLEQTGLNSELMRHKRLTIDFNNLFKDLIAEGYFEPSLFHVVLRLLDAFAWLVFAYGCFFHCHTVLSKFVAAMACGFALSRFGWIEHEAGHNSLTGKPKIDKFIQLLSYNLLIGCSSSWWNSQHNRHHAMPQRLEHDVDLATLPIVAFHTKTVKNRKELIPFLIRYQAAFYWTIDLLIASFMWRYFLHPRYLLLKKSYYELALLFMNLLFNIAVIGPGWNLVIMYWITFFLGINFSLSHSHLDVADKPTHWVEYSLTYTSNIQPSIFVDYFMGYLNYQIEHHLFPTMPQFRQRQICHRVKALAEKHGLKYQVYGYAEACALVIKNLNEVGKQLTSDRNNISRNEL